jgi:uncharacterized protein (TIGR03083 family)
VTTPSYPELVTAVRREGEGIAAAAGAGLAAAVPTCPGWDVAALIDHVSQVYARVANLALTRATEQPVATPPRPPGDPIEVFSDLLDNLVAALTECGADTPLWTWEPRAPKTAAFWARRMAHESAIHRFDAQAAHGVVQPLEADLAGDGIDELVDYLVHRVYSRDGVTGPTGTVRLESTENDIWDLRLEPSDVLRTDAVKEPDATARGTSSELLLAAYSRSPWSLLEVGGDAGLLERWSSAMSL